MMQRIAKPFLYPSALAAAALTIAIGFALAACSSTSTSSTPAQPSSQPALAPDELPPYPVKGTVIQTLEAFDNAESCIFSLDGLYAYVANAGEQGLADKGFGFTDKAGYVSKLAVQPDGTLKVLNAKLVTGLTGPLGLAVSTQGTRKFPRGTVFQLCGGAVMTDANGDPIKDPAQLNPLLVGFDATGKVLGEIRMGAGTAFAQVNGAPVLFPNGASFDAEGNCYVADTGLGGDRFEPAIERHPGLWMIPYESLDALADGKAPPRPVKFIAIAGAPNGVAVAPGWSIHVNTAGLVPDVGDPAEGGMYALSRSDFDTGHLPQPFQSGLGALDGLTFLGRTRLDTRILKHMEVVVTPPSSRPMRLVLEPATELTGPADIAVQRAADGNYILLIPDPQWTSTNAGQNPVIVVKLPANFEGR